VYHQTHQVYHQTHQVYHQTHQVYHQTHQVYHQTHQVYHQVKLSILLWESCLFSITHNTKLLDDKFETLDETLDTLDEHDYSLMNMITP